MARTRLRRRGRGRRRRGRLTPAGDDLTLACPDCGADHVPAPCPDCGGERLASTLDGGDRPVVACRGCGRTFDRPPVAEE